MIIDKYLNSILFKKIDENPYIEIAETNSKITGKNLVKTKNGSAPDNELS
jgi:hypothetical protein